jgi:hypothetical protein
MLLALPDTTMNDLLTAIKYNILLYQNSTLVKNKTYKKGVLPPIPVFPAITIIPENETLFGFQSGKEYKVNRRIRLDVYGFGRNLGSTHLNCVELANALKDIANIKYKWTSEGDAAQCYNTSIDSEIFGEPYPYKNRFLQKCSLTINCFSGETLPTQDLADTPVEEAADDFLTTLYDKILTYKTTTFVKIKSFAKGVTPPFSTYPALVVSENAETPTHYEAGRDKLERDFEIFIYHKLLDKEGILTRVISEVENAKTVILTNPKWDGTAVWSRITGIDYGVFSNENSYLYAAAIGFRVDAKKVLDLCS